MILRPALIVLMLAPAPALAQTWPQQKCALFTEAWATSAPAEGKGAPSPGFRQKIEAFIASGCETPRDACPATKADVELADALALIVALEGMSTTFLPISCP